MANFLNVFEEDLGLGKDENKIYLQIGAPGPEILKDVAKIMERSTKRHFDQSNHRNEEILQYGCSTGNKRFKEEIAKFLTQFYGHPVCSEDLFANNGASQGLANLLYHYFQSGETLYIGDPSYWNLIQTLKFSFNMNIVGIEVDEFGFRVDDMEKQLIAATKRQVTERYPYQAAVYLIPCYQNPTGCCLTQDRCEKLVQLARKYDLMVVSDDVYNVLTYSASDSADPTTAKPPDRLIRYDKKSDPGYKGNVISLGSLSKILAPGLRIGWYEAPVHVRKSLKTNFITTSASSWNEYTSGILASGFESGDIRRHVIKIRALFWARICRVHEIVTGELGELGVKCGLPKGGVFMWITLPSSYSTKKLLDYCKDELTFVAGSKCSVNGKYENCLRICVAFYDDDVLYPAVFKLCIFIRNFISKHSSKMNGRAIEA